VNEITVDSVIDKAIDIFFPPNYVIQKYGEKSNYSFRLQDSNERILNEFIDNEGKKCMFTDYLDITGRTISHLKPYLLSSDKKLETENLSSSEEKDESNEMIEMSDSDSNTQEISNIPALTSKL
jgi:hypothetical protein